MRANTTITIGLSGVAIAVAAAAAVAGALVIWVLFATIAAGPAAGQDSPTRQQYVRALEPVCKKDTARNARILKGVRAKVRKGKLAPAARQFAKATRAYSGTLRTILREPRPPEDRGTLARWIRLLKKQRTYLQRITKALKAGQGFKAQTLSVHLFSNADQANNAVTGYGFRHCLINPRKFI